MAAGTEVNKPPLTGVPRSVRYFLAALVVAAPFSVVVASGAHAHAQDVTCQGVPATVVGPTEGAINTNGTPGDDVIVAPIGPYRTVQGLGGDDTICLVNGLQSTLSEQSVSIQAGAGNDSVVNEADLYPGRLVVELGTGADHYVGADYAEAVYGAWSSELPQDTEPDAIETRGGDDWISSGSPGITDRDVIATGAGRDSVTYVGAAGGTLDNGPDPDSLLLTGKWEGDLAVDNITRRATIGDGTVLAWTAVDTFSMRAARRGRVSFVGSDAPESIYIVNMGQDLAAPSQITTGGGDDSVGLQAYLPVSVDLGEGDDSLSYAACHRAYVALDVSAECLTIDGREVSTALVGIESFDGRSTNGLTVRGTERAERVTASARYVLVRSGPGADRVRVFADRTAEVVGGRGADRLTAFADRGAILRGGWGGDVLRGGHGPDTLLGGAGQDRAYGKQGRDLCDAEVRDSCQRP